VTIHVSRVKTYVNAVKMCVAALRICITALKTCIAAVKITIATLETCISAVKIIIATLETCITAVKIYVATLETCIAVARTYVAMLKTDSVTVKMENCAQAMEHIRAIAGNRPVMRAIPAPATACATPAASVGWLVNTACRAATCRTLAPT